jgi:regulator of nucleoside diphosphate kinase
MRARNNTATIARAPAEPPVVLDAAYADRLQGLAFASAAHMPEVADRLLHEIDRAIVLPSRSVPPDVVNIGSQVTFLHEPDDQVQTVVLVLPQDADIARRRVSVLTPVGAALIGLAEGASITWDTRTGETRRLTVLRVEPAPAGR